MKKIKTQKNLMVWLFALLLVFPGFLSGQDEDVGKTKTITIDDKNMDMVFYPVDQVGDVGLYSSISFSNGELCFSYYDNTNDDLKFAKGNNGSYQLETVDQTGDVGKYTSLIMDASGHENIVYFDDTKNTLKFAGWLRTWEFETIDSGGDVGLYSSIGLNTNDELSISYYDNTNHNLKYANQSGGSWTTQEVDTTGDVGKYTSLVIDSENHNNIIYFDDTKNTLKFAGWLRTWEFETIDSNGDVGLYSSIELNANNEMSISYYDNTNQNLKYANQSGGSWTTQTIDETGVVGKYTSLVKDPLNNNSNIVYFDDTKNTLKFAGWLRTWEFETVDETGDVGLYSSIACNDYNQLYISYYDNTNKDLKFTTLDGSTWTNEVIASTDDVGKYTSLTMSKAGFGNKAHVVYFDDTQNDLLFTEKELPIADVGNIAGTITNIEGGIPVSGATVEAYNTSTTISYIIQGKADGSYEVKSIPPGNYTVKAIKTGYVSDSILNVSVTIGNTNFVDFSLTPNVSSLVANYPFNGNANDMSEYGNDGVVYDATLTTNRFGSVNSAYDFDGLQSYIEVPHDISLSLQQWTFTSWIKIDTAVINRPHIILAKGEAPNDNMNYYIYVDVDSTFNLSYEEANDVNYHLISDEKIIPGIWYYVAAVRNAEGNLKVFANNISVSGFEDAVPSTQPSPLYIGAHYSQPTIGVSGFFNGKIDDVCIYNRALSDSEILELYNSNCNYNDVPEDHYAYNAVSYLCTEGLLDNDGFCEPESSITRAALAKLAYLSINLGANAYADDFPSPFNDLQNPDVWYYSYAKNLSYLEFDNEKAPFDKEFFNFYPSRGISRAHTLKVLLETWNVDIQTGTGLPYTDVEITHDAYKYIYTAYQLGIISDNPDHIFGPDVDVYRGEVFVMLYRMMENTKSLIVPTVTVNDFFVPGNYTPENFASFKGMHSGNFNFYTKSSFAIAGIGLPLTFEHTYNSYLTEMPNELMPLKPLGEGWGHTFNSCIRELPGDVGSPEDFTVVVILPGGAFNVYAENGNAYHSITQGVYNILSKPDASTFILTTKSQIVYTYEKLTGAGDDFPYVLTSIHDRNNNTVSILYEASEVSPSGHFRISQVIGTAGRTLEFNYHSGSDLVSDVTDPLGRNISFDYDSEVPNLNNKLILFKDAKDQNTVYNYGSGQAEKNLLMSIQLPKGNVITNSYEGKKLVSTQTNGNQPTQFAYERNYEQSGNDNFTQTTTTNPDGEITITDYNRNGNPHFVDSPVANVNIAYNATQLTKPESISVNGQSAGFVYDDMGNVLDMNMPLGISHHFQYNTMNDVTQYTDPRGKIYTNVYNSYGNLDQSITPRGTTTFNHNDQGQLLSTINPVGITVSYTYDTYGNLIQTDKPEGISSSQTYDLVGRVLTATDPRGTTTSFNYDANDNLLTETISNLVTGFGFDANDNLVSITNAKGGVTSMNYEFETDFLSSVGFGGYTDSYTYLEDGKLETRTDPNGNTFTSVYDGLGRLSSVTSSGDNLSYTYDEFNNILSVTNNSGTIHFEYDELNRMTKTTDFWNNDVTYIYDAASNLIEMVYPGNKSVIYTYYDDNLLHTVKDWNNSVTTYTYRDDGALTRIDYGNGTYCTYSYDNAGRQTGHEWRTSGGSIINAYDFELDAAGNHTRETITEPYSTPVIPSEETAYTYNTVNRITTAGTTSFSFDNNGNTLSKGTFGFQYDDNDRLVSANGTSNKQYMYDGIGHRRQKTLNSVVTRYILDIVGMSKVLMETDAAGTPQNYYIYGLGLISRINNSNQTSYYHYDFRGSTIALTDETETITHQYQYDEFGKLVQFLEADFNPYRYVGAFGVTYEEDDLYFMRARYYDPEIGRFLSEDPVWSVNLYPYGGNNAITGIDPKGESVIETGIGFFTQIGSTFNSENDFIQNVGIAGGHALSAVSLTEEFKNAGNVKTFFRSGMDVKKWSLFSKPDKLGIAGVVLSAGLNTYTNYKEGVGAQSIPKALIQTGIGGITLGLDKALFGVDVAEEFFVASDNIGDAIGGWIPKKKHKVFTEEEVRANILRNRNN
jgi:RHS repeat-associated protein